MNLKAVLGENLKAGLEKQVVCLANALIMMGLNFELKNRQVRDLHTALYEEPARPRLCWKSRDESEVEQSQNGTTFLLEPSMQDLARVTWC